MSNFDNFNIDLLKINDIVINNAAIENNTKLTQLENDRYFFDIEYGFIPGVKMSEKKVRLIFNCEIKTFSISKEKIDVQGRFEISFFFEVENLDKLIIPEDEIIVDSGLMETLANITYSTARGIIYTRCQGTILKSLILPVMPTKMLVEMLPLKDDSES
jgi:hypothetical protein